MAKSQKIKELSKNTVLFVVSSFGARIISFVLIPFYTYLLSTEEYGTTDLLITTAQLLIPILTVNIQDAVLRFSMDKRYAQEDVIRVGVNILGISSIVLGAILFILGFFDLLTLEANYILFLFVLFFTGALNNILSMYLKAKNRVKILAVWGIVNTAVTCGFNIFLLFFFKLGINGYMISYVSGTLVADIGMLFFGEVVKDLKRQSVEFSLKKEMLLYSAPLMANSLGWWINSASDRYILTYFSGAEANGVYAIAYKIPAILSALQSVFYNAWSISSIAEFDKSDEDGFIGDTYTVYSSLSFLACSLIMFLNIPIARVLYANEFFVAWKYVPLLLVGTVFNGLGLFNGCIFAAVKNTAAISFTTVISAIINTTLNFLLIPIAGPYGAAFATMIGYYTIWFSRIIKMKKIIRMKVNWKNQIYIIVVVMLQCLVASISNVIVYQLPFVLILILLQWKILSRIISKVLLSIKRMWWRKI